MILLLAYTLFQIFLLLYNHSNKVSFHGAFEPIIILQWVDYCGHFAPVKYLFELSLEHLINRVLLNEVYDPEPHLLSLGVDYGEEGVVDNVGLREL